MTLNRILFFLGAVATSFPLSASVDIKTIVREIGPGKTFERVIEDLGFSKKDAVHLLVDRAVPSKLSLRAHDKYLVIKDPRTSRVEARFYLDYSDDALVFWRDGTKSGVSRQTVPFKVVRKTFEGKVHGSLVESIKKLIDDDWVAFRFVDAFAWDLNLGKELQRNDSFKFTLEEKYDEDHFVRYSEILQAELTTGGIKFKRVLWQNQATKVFVDPATRFDDRPFYAPVDYVHVSSPFSKRRYHPVRHNYQPHLGVDFALNEGAPVYAPRDGVVEEVGHTRSNGNFIRLRHDHGFTTMYNHLKTWGAGVKQGIKIAVGQVIGYVGCTGYCTNAHLDFRIRRGNYLYDPVYLTRPFPFKERNYYLSDKFKAIATR